jgi:hypothetical protein
MLTVIALTLTPPGRSAQAAGYYLGSLYSNR